MDEEENVNIGKLKRKWYFYKYMCNVVYIYNFLIICIRFSLKDIEKIDFNFDKRSIGSR